MYHKKRNLYPNFIMKPLRKKSANRQCPSPRSDHWFLLNLEQYWKSTLIIKIGWREGHKMKISHSKRQTQTKIEYLNHRRIHCRKVRRLSLNSLGNGWIFLQKYLIYLTHQGLFLFHTSQIIKPQWTYKFTLKRQKNIRKPAIIDLTKSEAKVKEEPPLCDYTNRRYFQVNIKYSLRSIHGV